jgi:tRNA A37 methylthiotransferase MiaB
MVAIINVRIAIPLARGISRSDELENVLKNAEISETKHQEIVLTGSKYWLRKRRIWK